MWGNGPALNIDGGDAAGPHQGVIDSPLIFNNDPGPADRLMFSNQCFNYRSSNLFHDQLRSDHSALQESTWRKLNAPDAGYVDIYNDIPDTADKIYSGVVVTTLDVPSNANERHVDQRRRPALHEPFNQGAYGTATPPLHPDNTAPIVHDVFINLSRGATVVTSGKWNNGTYVMALYRGTPTAADLSYSQLYGAEGLPLGPHWVDGPMFVEGSYTVSCENHLSDGAYVAGENNEPVPIAVFGSIRTTASYPGDQFIEATVGNFFQGHDPSMPEGYQWVEGDMWLLTQVVGGASQACLGAYVIIQTNQGPGFTGGCYMQIISVDAAGVRSYHNDGTYSPLTGWQDNPSYTIRLETTEDGNCKAFFDGHLVAEDDMTPTGGLYVGMAQQWNRTTTPAPCPTSPPHRAS